MLMVRFQRAGRKNDPAFRIVVTEKRSKPVSGGLEIVGSYHPKTKHTVLNTERILYWLSKGAQASPTLHNLLIAKGVLTGKKVNVVRAPVKPVVPSLVAEGSAPEVTKEGGARPVADKSNT